MWTNLVLVSSCVSCWSLVLFTDLIFPPHRCPIRLISPALHLHCTSFTGLSSSSSTSLLLVFFCSFPHLSLSTCTHLPHEVCLCVSLCCWLALCRDTHILCVLAFGSCVTVDWSSSRGCQPLLLLDLMDQKSRLHSRHFDFFS